MLHENNTIGEVKDEVLYQVAKAAFEGNLHKIEATLPYEILPGTKPKFRCCVHKEREIVRQPGRRRALPQHGQDPPVSLRELPHHPFFRDRQLPEVHGQEVYAGVPFRSHHHGKGQGIHQSGKM